MNMIQSAPEEEFVEMHFFIRARKKATDLGE